MAGPKSYFALIDGFEATTERLRRANEVERVHATHALIEIALPLIAEHARIDFEKLAVWHADKAYRLVNAVDMLDAASFAFFRAVGSAFNAVAKQHGLSIAYLVDYAIDPAERLLGIAAAFNALGFMVASPEVFAIKLGEHDGISANEAIGARFPHYRAEAAGVAMQLFERAIEGEHHVLWLSGSCDLDELRHVARTLENAPFVGVFRNDTPVDGSEVQVFRSKGRSTQLG